MTDPWLWLNGALIAADKARIDPADRGLLLGDGLFETMRAAGGTIQDLPRHYARLQQGAALLRLPVPLREAAIAEACQALLAANNIADAALRLTFTRGPGPRGLAPPANPAPTIMITAAPLPPPGGPLRLITASIRRDEASPLSRIKSLNYLPGVLARIEAAEQGADDALMLNGKGLVAETTAATLFVKLGGAWYTPAVEDGALPGIRRASLLEAGRVREASLTPAQLRAAAAVLAGNVLSLRPVTALDGQPIPAGDATELS